MAELTERRRARLKAYCRLDDLAPDEDVLLEELFHSSVEYLADAGVSDPPADNGRRARFDLAVSYLVLDAWDRRDATITGTIVAENPAFRRLINQLKLTEPAPDLGAGGGA